MGAVATAPTRLQVPGGPIAWLVVALLSAGWVQGAAAQATGVTPAPLRAFDLAAAIERHEPEVLSLDTWLTLDALLADAQANEALRVHPAEAALWRATPPQHWLNWPALKPAADRALREAVVDAQLGIDRAFFAAAANAAPPALRNALAQVAQERLRRALGVWPLLDAEVVDLAIAIPLALGSDPLPPACRARIDAALDAWSTEHAALFTAQIEERRRAFDRLEFRLTDQGIDLPSLAPDDEPAMARAFDAWEEVSVLLADRTREMLALQDRALDRICRELTPLRASWVRDQILSRSYRHSSRSDRAFAGWEFDRALRIRTLTDERRRAITERRDQWCIEDAALLQQWCKDHAATAPSYCPLTYSHMGPGRRYGSIEGRRLELSQGRIILAQAALKDLRALLGVDADVLDGSDDRDDPRLTAPLPTELPAHFSWRRDERPWTPRTSAQLFHRTWPFPAWFDHGAITPAEAESLAAWIGLDPSARAAWIEALALLTANLPAPATTGQSLGGWTFDEQRYRYDRAKADRALRDSAARFTALREAEQAWFLLAQSLAADENAQRRARFVAAVREMQVLLQPIADATRDARMEHRAESLIATALLDGFLLHADRRDEVDSFIAVSEPQWKALQAATRARCDATLAEVQRSAALADEAMWLRGPEAETIARMRQAQRAVLLDLDAPHRMAMIAAIDAWRPAIRDAASNDEDPIFARAERLDQAQAFPSILGSDPNIVARLQADLDARRTGDAEHAPGPAETIAALTALRDWHHQADAALVAEALAECTLAPPSAAPLDPDWQARISRLDAIRERREELADRAEVRRRLILRAD